MPRRVLDTNILINYWIKKVKGKRLADLTRPDAARWGRAFVVARRN